MASTHRLLSCGPGYAAPPPTPAELESAVGEHQQRHRLRLDGLECLRQLEVELSKALDEALQPITAAEEPSWLTRALISAGLIQPELTGPPALETLWARHERALEKVRALSHHVDLLDRDLAQLAVEIPQLTEQIRCLSADRVKAEAHEVALASARQRSHDSWGGERQLERGAIVGQLDRALWEVRRDRVRLEAATARLVSLKLLHQELEGILQGVSTGLEQLYRDATVALEGLNHRISGLAAEAAAAALDEGGGLEALQHSLADLAVTAGKRAVWLEHSLDSLSEKLALLDAEAAERRRARAEVEQALEHVGDA
ncbi:MAG: hypothetical protein P8R54_24060 [Myxococcota bacterium]|nr:hypothetical protein [Myxococcota bacterium]